MATLAELVIKITGDATGFEKTVDGAKSKAQDIGKAMTGVGVGLTAGVTVPLLGLGKAAFEASSDTAEAMSKVEVVFDSAAGTVKDFAGDAAFNLGISQQKALEAAGTYGNLFETMELGKEQTASMSNEMVQLAADLGSFHNLDVDVALNKLRAALTGESEPLKALGYVINEAQVKAKALEMGLGDLNGVLSEGEKMQARYALIMELTSTAQGDFGRTSEGAANQAKILAAQAEDISSAFGDALRPAVQDGQRVLMGLLEKFNNLNPSTREFIVDVLILVAALGPVLSIVGSLVTIFPALSGAISAAGTVFAAITAPVGMLVLALVALGLTIAIFGEDAMNTLNMIGAIIAAVFQRSWYEISTFFSNLFATWKGNWENLVAIVKAVFNLDWGFIGTNITSGIAAGIRNGIGALTAAAGEAASALMGKLQGLLGIHSPSALAAKEIGAPFVQGIELEVAAGLRNFEIDLQQAVSGLSLGQGGGMEAQGGGGSNYEITINNPAPERASESIPRALQKMAYLGVTT